MMGVVAWSCGLEKMRGVRRRCGLVALVDGCEEER